MTYISASMNKERSGIHVWERTESGQRIVRRFDTPYYFYIENEQGTYKDIHGKNLVRHNFTSYNRFKEAKDEYKRDNVNLFESDINPVYKVLSEHYYNKPVGTLNYTFFDIEVDYHNYCSESDTLLKIRNKSHKELEISVRELRQIYTKTSIEVYEDDKWIKAQESKHIYEGDVGFPSPEECYAKVSAISLYHSWTDKMSLLVLLPDNGKWTKKDIPQDCHDLADVIICKDEEELLKLFYKEIDNSDVISGWNSEGFDIPYMYYRTKKILGEKWANKLSFSNALPPREKEVEVYVGSKQKQVEIFGRCHLDYLLLFKKLETTTRPSFTLDAISEEILPEEKKLEYDCSLYDLYYERFPDFCRYNIRDTVVLKGFEHKLGYMGVAISATHNSTVLINDILGTIRLCESAINNVCHYELDMKVPDVKDIARSSTKFAGALVLYPKIGWHKNVVSTDFSSLYPSTIRALNASPDTIIGQFHNDYVAFEEISKKTDVMLTLIRDDGKTETHKANEWINVLKERSYALSAYGTIFNQKDMGLIPAILKRWYNDRVEYKKKAKEAKIKLKKLDSNSQEYIIVNEEYNYYHKLQFVLKIRLNSVYGMLGNIFCRFYDLRIAESTTRSGKESLLHMNRTIANYLDGKKTFDWFSAQELPDNYSFPHESIIYSDTDSCYFSLENKDLGDINKVYEYGKTVEKVINDEMPNFSRNYFFCNEGYDSILKVELDVIADNSIFIKKKYYVMHLLYDEGMPKEKMKIMGVQIKKTTIPKPISKTLTKYIEDLLKGKDWVSIAKEAVQYKDYLLESAKITEIGLPKGIKGIEKYTEQYNLKIPHLRIPGHVAAAMMYNKCLETYHDVASPKIVSGMKIKTYYLKKKFGYFKSIALPTDLQIIPDWFRENFEPLVDKKMQIDRLVDKPLDSILNAIGKVAPTIKSITIEELFEY